MAEDCRLAGYVQFIPGILDRPRANRNWRSVASSGGTKLSLRLTAARCTLDRGNDSIASDPGVVESISQYDDRRGGGMCGQRSVSH
jgi:hypothetical protein